jgi:hypothetical protein
MYVNRRSWVSQRHPSRDTTRVVVSIYAPDNAGHAADHEVSWFQYVCSHYTVHVLNRQAKPLAKLGDRDRCLRLLQSVVPSW